MSRFGFSLAKSKDFQISQFPQGILIFYANHSHFFFIENITGFDSSLYSLFVIFKTIGIFTLAGTVEVREFGYVCSKINLLKAHMVVKSTIPKAIGVPMGSVCNIRNTFAILVMFGPPLA